MDLPGGGGDMAFRDWGYKGLVGVCWGKGWKGLVKKKIKRKKVNYFFRRF